MSVLVTLEKMKAHLRLDTSLSSPAAPLTDADVDLQGKIDVAEALVLDYVKQRIGDTSEDWSEEVDGWDDETAPKQVLLAVMLLAADFWRFRGDDEATPPVAYEGALPPGVLRCLYRLRDPSVA